MRTQIPTPLTICFETDLLGRALIFAPWWCMESGIVRIFPDGHWLCLHICLPGRPQPPHRGGLHARHPWQHCHAVGLASQSPASPRHQEPSLPHHSMEFQRCCRKVPCQLFSPVPTSAWSDTETCLCSSTRCDHLRHHAFRPRGHAPTRSHPCLRLFPLSCRVDEAGALNSTVSPKGTTSPV